jgi:hypothetical protein
VGYTPPATPYEIYYRYPPKSTSPTPKSTTDAT